MNRRHIILIYKGEFLSFIFSVNNYILNTYMQFTVRSIIPQGNHKKSIDDIMRIDIVRSIIPQGNHKYQETVSNNIP